MTDPSNAGAKDGIVFERITKDFRLPKKQSVRALQDLSMSVGRGEFVALLGPSGCGKSTALRLAAALDDPTEGSVRVLGDDPSQIVHSHRLGGTFQEHAPLPWLSVTKLLELPYRLAGRTSTARGSTSCPSSSGSDPSPRSPDPALERHSPAGGNRLGNRP